MATLQTPTERPGLVKFERILCPVDFSDFSVKAYAYATSLAQHYRAKLFLEHVVQPLTSAYPYYAFPDAWNDIIWNLDAHADAELRKLVKSHNWNGLQPDLVVQRGMVTDSILAFAKTQSVDLIVMGTHGRQGIDHLAMGSVAEKVLRKAHCPVLVVRNPSHDFVAHEKGQDLVQLQKIFFCTDFSQPSERALCYALTLAMEYNAELNLLHVLEHMPSSSDLEGATSDAIQQMRKAVPSDAYDWCKVRCTVRVGKPYQEIVQLALETNTDLAVMGVRGRNALDLALFGSTTHRVIQMGSCPVLAVRA